MSVTFSSFIFSITFVTSHPPCRITIVFNHRPPSPIPSTVPPPPTESLVKTTISTPSCSMLLMPIAWVNKKGSDRSRERTKKRIGIKTFFSAQKPIRHIVNCQRSHQLIKSNNVDGKIVKKEHHLWNKRDSVASGQKALNLVRTVCGLPNEKEAIYGALDKWTAWETEFPVIAVAKALNILKQRKQWKRVIQVAKWMFGKGQGMTMGTFDTLLLAFDMDQRVDEAQSFWNMILHTHERSISRRLFSRMISMYAHHNMPHHIIEVFADMEELGVKPDEDTARKVARAFKNVGETEKQQLVLNKYLKEWKYIHFNGERVRVRRKYSWNDD